LALLSAGCADMSTARRPSFDLGWVHDDCLFVAEVKSVTPANEERQLRLGLGQLLRYRWMLSAASAAVR
jgi:hypothetical protein